MKSRWDPLVVGRRCWRSHCLPRARCPRRRPQLTVYTALETDQLKAYQEGFNKAHPDIEITWVRDSTGVITAEAPRRKGQPKADVIMGVAATSMAIFENEGMLLPYAPAGLARDRAAVPRPARIRRRGSAWTCGARRSASTPSRPPSATFPSPRRGRTSPRPIYKGQIVMPHPASSGTGFFDVTAWLQIFGEADGWKFMDGLHENIAQYMHSGSRPCAAAAAGEYVGRHLVRVSRQPREGAGQADRPRVSRRKASAGTSRPSAS